MIAGPLRAQFFADVEKSPAGGTETGEKRVVFFVLYNGLQDIHMSLLLFGARIESTMLG